MICKKFTIFIDESGTLPDPKDKVIIVAAVGIDNPNEFLDISNKVRKKIKFFKKEKEISEIKFYRAGEHTKILYLNEMAGKEIDIFALIVEKEKMKIADSPNNFAILAYFLIEECLLFYNGGKGIKEIIFDKHFSKQKDQEEFTKLLLKFLDADFIIKHWDSQKNTEVNVADMIAGSLLWKYTKKEEKFYNIIKKRIVSEKFLNWKQIKRKFFTKTKNL